MSQINELYLKKDNNWWMSFYLQRFLLPDVKWRILMWFHEFSLPGQLLSNSRFSDESVSCRQSVCVSGSLWNLSSFNALNSLPPSESLCHFSTMRTSVFSDLWPLISAQWTLFLYKCRQSDKRPEQQHSFYVEKEPKPFMFNHVHI